MTVAGQTAVDYSWDNANRLTAITQGTNSVGFSYDAANRRTQLTLPTGIVVAYSYDSDSHVTGMTWTMGGNQLGNLTYAYDADGRVISKGGSFAQINLPAAASGNTFNADNAMTGFNGNSLSYDANGNLTSDGTYTYTWDARNHLTQITQKRTTVATFQYDAFGRRVEKTVNGATTQYLYDGLNPVEELNGASPASVTETMLTGLGIDQYFARTNSSGTTSSYLTDMLGSTIALANSSGALTTQYSYEPYGATTISGSSTNPFQFTGRENDGTGLYYYRARYYSPTYGRFISQDPLGFGGGDPNLYGYDFDDPIDRVDRLGLLTFEVFGQRIHIDYSVTILNTIFSWDLKGFSPHDVSVNMQLGASIGDGFDFNINQPGPCKPWVSPYIGFGKNISLGRNLVLNPKNGSYTFQGYNVSLGESWGAPGSCCLFRTGAFRRRAPW